MNSIALALRACLLIVFATAGAAKLYDLNGSRDTIRAFGLPQRMAVVSGLALPLTELACALALIFRPAARWGALGCLVLLIVFSAGVTYALRNGRTPDCNCFGQVSSKQISWRTLARNAVLAAVAAVVVVDGPGASLAGWTGSLTAANVVASLAVVITALLGVTSLHLRSEVAALRDARHEYGPLGGRPPALPIGSVAPAFELPDLTGARVSLETLQRRGLPIVLVFASQTCAPCAALMPELARWAAALEASVTIAVIESGISDTATLRSQIESHSELRILTESGREVAERYRVPATPTGVGIDPEGRVATAPAAGADAIEELVRSALGHPGLITA